MLWECMVIALKATVGGILWSIVGALFMASLGIIFYFINREKAEEFMEENGFKKPKWDGKPIVVEGEKKNE